MIKYINKITILLIYISTHAFSEENIESIVKKSNDNLFITDYEYGQMLYNNPRGIGCIKCHGKNGKKKIIAEYSHKEKEVKIYAPDIDNISLEKFMKFLKNKRSTKSIMPTYFLTSEEIKSIHLYITNRKNL